MSCMALTANYHTATLIELVYLFLQLQCDNETVLISKILFIALMMSSLTLAVTNISTVFK